MICYVLTIVKEYQSSKLMVTFKMRKLSVNYYFRYAYLYAQRCDLPILILTRKFPLLSFCFYIITFQILKLCGYQGRWAWCTYMYNWYVLVINILQKSHFFVNKYHYFLSIFIRFNFVFSAFVLFSTLIVNFAIIC